ncbi:unnamed protein product [Albugo candida]|uniref:Uncharacterized protein n=1 Tax=Albugo candida TaxID=65357 RepID=A0A024GKN3_9STRA|nr:unnamed protein product [Albugo candida]|eukprot:CCI47328.1 unnamed protein product [Albugo candida]
MSTITYPSRNTIHKTFAGILTKSKSGTKIWRKHQSQVEVLENECKRLQSNCLYMISWYRSIPLHYMRHKRVSSYVEDIYALKILTASTLRRREVKSLSKDGFVSLLSDTFRRPKLSWTGYRIILSRFVWQLNSADG